jgi:hypothetical protein
MRCIVYYEPFGRTRQEQREGTSRFQFLLNDGFAYHSITFAKEEMRDFAKHLRRQGWKTKGSMRQGYYQAFRGRKHRIVWFKEVD